VRHSRRSALCDVAGARGSGQWPDHEGGRFAERRPCYARATAPVTATQALFAATLGGARALGLDGQIGSLAEGMQADLIAVALDGAHQQPPTNPVDALIFPLQDAMFE